ncbi:hypothetical protein AVEN_77749-1 [Araneus ventricosus]|uniref:Uncharacterized protein n=1 Tax=Araneus ventricosus TaxID=182803 RepID=A0A4Y2TYB4_ARAVE|nr:hypothetical protein AVEN_77749-1 [Araneus ventricosus]
MGPTKHRLSIYHVITAIGMQIPERASLYVAAVRWLRTHILTFPENGPTETGGFRVWQVSSGRSKSESIRLQLAYKSLLSTALWAAIRLTIGIRTLRPCHLYLQPRLSRAHGNVHGPTLCFPSNGSCWGSLPGILSRSTLVCLHRPVIFDCWGGESVASLRFRNDKSVRYLSEAA